MPRTILAGLLAAALAAGVIRTAAPVAAQATTVTVTGTLAVLWGDPDQVSGAQPVQLITVTDNANISYALAFDEGILQAAGGLRALDGQVVTVVGRSPGSGAAARAGFQGLSVSSLIPAISRPAGMPLEDVRPAVTGSQPWVTILCRFADSTGVTPHPASYYDALLGTVNPGMDHYWREVSYDNINIVGSQTAGWFNLPSPRSTYIPAGGSANLSLLKEDCASAADAVVFFPNFVGINFVFNQDLDCCAWGGGTVLNRDGQNKVYRATWMPPWAQVSGVFAHEMGHGFGFPHSSGPYAQTYDSNWDPMSNAHNSKVYNATYGPTPAHTITYHKNLDGWIPDARRYTAGTGTHTIMIERLSQPPAGSTYLMAKIPIGGSATRFYTVEARRFVGYDAAVPFEAIVIHNVDETRSDRDAQVVDATNDNNPNDAGAAWVPGETFTDAANQISISVFAASGAGWVVGIQSGPVCTYSILPTSVSVPATPTAGSVGVTTLTGCAWTAVSNAAFVTVTGGSSGNGAGTVSYNVAANLNTSNRSGTVTIAGKTFTVNQQGASIVTGPDFNGDGRLDLVWHHQGDGSIAAWLMNGLTLIDGTLMSPSQVPDTTWKIVGTGDLDGDGAFDLVWQNIADGRVSAWLMNGLTLREGALFSIPQVPDLQWKIRAVGDLNGDRRADLFWQHEGTGDIAVWLMNGLNVIDATLLNPSRVEDLNWKIAGAADFDGNGSRDLVWHHQGDGRIAIWYMNGTSQIGGSLTNPGQVPDLNWKIRGVGDLNGDGRPDFIWQNIADGRISAWLMNGLNRLEGTLLSLSQVPDTDWHIVGPR